ncbi:MAG TPA: hypothetical protein PKN62_01255 [bacterium]|nr:hypothetical protein [bacterium]
MSPKQKKNIEEKVQGIGELKRELEFFKKQFPDFQNIKKSLRRMKTNRHLRKFKKFLKETLGLPILANNISLLRRFIDNRIAEMQESIPTVS